MGKRNEIYLDIETNGYDLVTVIGFDSDETGPVQLYGKDVTRKKLLASLPASGVMYTFNGEKFDIPKIAAATGVDLLERYRSCDLMRVGWAHGLKGGQKALEDELGFERELPGLSGLSAIEFWKRYTKGDQEALDDLLKYNAEDLAGMRFLKAHFESDCCLSSSAEHSPRRRQLAAARGGRSR
ncbi:MAG: exonuclease [Acidobacteria bacterium]|nr:MAG: exonuclease [Acidobacteriota bacterium]